MAARLSSLVKQGLIHHKTARKMVEMNGRRDEGSVRQMGEVPGNHIKSGSRR
jgi:hypothetical protein